MKSSNFDTSYFDLNKISQNLLDLKGMIIGSVIMVDCIEIDNTFEHLTLCKIKPNSYGFVFENPQLFEHPERIKGKLGIFNVDINIS